MEETKFQPAVKDGAQEKFWQRLQEIKNREDLRIAQQRESQIKIKKLNSHSKYLESVQSLAARWFYLTLGDCRQIEQENDEFAILDKLLLRKAKKNLLVSGSAAAVLGLAFCFANIAVWAVTPSFKGSPHALNDFLFLCSLSGLAVVDIFLAVKSVKYFKRNSLKEINFLYHRKLALSARQESKKEAEDAR